MQSLKVAIRFTDPCPVAVADVMIASVRRHMDCKIVHCTDLTTAQLPDTDEILRSPPDADLGAARLRDLMRLQGDILSLDYDVVVQQDVSTVFERRFDVALTRREIADPTVSELIRYASPHNMGVIFTRSPEFWTEVYRRYMTHPEHSDWLWIQTATTETAWVMRKKYRVIELPGEIYNYTPAKREESVAGRAIVHYKGRRKEWMVPEADAEAAKAEGKRVIALMNAKSGNFRVSSDNPAIKRLSDMGLVANKNDSA